MKPAYFEIVSGNNEDFEIALSILDEDGVAFDFTGYTAFELHAKTNPYDPEPALAFADGVGIMVEGLATAGVIALYAPEADVTALDGVYVFDARATVDGKQKKIFEGTIEIVQGKTV